MSSALPRVTIRSAPEDFIVEELPAYPASGRGEHLYVTFEKVGLTTQQAVEQLARALDVDSRGAGWAGQKDRHAKTTQSVTLPFPLARGEPEAALAALSFEGLRVLETKRHDNKLKPGHLRGNRFTLVLRDVDPKDLDAIAASLVAIGVSGVPNAFGPQRFGRDGHNAERAFAWLAGKERGPRDRYAQRMLFSSLQSLLFNRVLDRRVEAGTFMKVMPGDLAKKHDSGGLFLVAMEGAELDDARARADAGLLSATGPMFGVKMRWPEGEPAAIERSVLDESLGTDVDAVARLASMKHLGEGTRRSLRMFASELEVLAIERDDGRGRGSLAVRFMLPKGGYATTVLARACTVVDATRAARIDGGPESPPNPPDRGDDAEAQQSDEANE